MFDQIFITHPSVIIHPNLFIFNLNLSYFCLSPLPNLILFFIYQKMALFLFFSLFFSSCDMHKPHIFLDDILHKLIFCLSLSYMFYVVYIYTPSHNSNMNNSFRIIIVKISIIKDNIVKVYNITTNVLAKNATLSENLLATTIS